jgi:sortase A
MMWAPRIEAVFRWSGNLLLLSGIAALAWCGYVLVEARLFQDQADAYLERAIQARTGGTGGFIGRLTEGEPLGRMDIPRIGMSVVVLEGIAPHTLRLGVGHVPGTALPGAPGNVALAGHRDTFFRGLRKIHKGDAIMVTTLRGSYTYVVESTKVVPPDDVAVLDRTSRPALTLVTCYPFYFVGAAPKRFIVRAYGTTG